MPHQIVAENKHVVLLAESNVAICRIEVKFVRLRMNLLPLKQVFWRDCVELLDDKFKRLWLIAHHLVCG